jgi:N-succinyldiaminopimelate aminotransferase
MTLRSAKRLHAIQDSIFSTMSKMAVEHNAVNLGQGFPDFDGPSWLHEKAFEAMQEGKNQYAPSPGIFSLRNNIAKISKENYAMDWDPNAEITVFAGATEALYCAVTSLIDEGDEVIMFEPYYDAHQSDVLLAGGIPRYVTLHKPDFSFDLNELNGQLSDRTKAIILNTPHNPTGKVFDKEELQQIADIAIEYDLVVISDEVYEYLTYDDVEHIPIASLDGMKKRTITISSTGKTFGMTGWKIGYACAKESLTTAMRKVRQWTTFAVNTPMQHAMAYGFERLDGYLPDFRKLYKSKRDLMLNELKKTDFNAHIPKGSYFIMIDIPENKYENDVDASIKLVKDSNVATIPPSVFYSKSDEGKTMLRLCFAKNDQTIIEGIQKLANA